QTPKPFATAHVPTTGVRTYGREMLPGAPNKMRPSVGAVEDASFNVMSWPPRSCGSENLRRGWRSGGAELDGADGLPGDQQASHSDVVGQVHKVLRLHHRLEPGRQGVRVAHAEPERHQVGDVGEDAGADVGAAVSAVDLAQRLAGEHQAQAVLAGLLDRLGDVLVGVDLELVEAGDERPARL